MNNNRNLNRAKKAKNDEFYTQLKDVEEELKHYSKHFKDKIIYCNCDDPTFSAFWQYFHINFGRLGLKSLISTHYNRQSQSYKMQYWGGQDADITVGEKTPLEGDGDFRSPECVEILKECDIVVTNPPFSLFRECIAQLTEYKKMFLVIGHQNAITYKEVFPLIKENKIWLGNGFKGNVGFFKSPYEDTAAASEHCDGMIRVSGVMWLTNIDYKEKYKRLVLQKTYNAKEYPKFDNYNAIEVSKTVNIPCDYDGVMGVPISFIYKYNPEQFEIIEVIDGGCIKGKKIYKRIAIRRRTQQTY